MEPDKGQKSIRKLEEGVRRRPSKSEVEQHTSSPTRDYPVRVHEDLLQQQHFASSLKIPREGFPRKVGRRCKPKVTLLEQLHSSKSQPVTPAFMAPRVDPEHSLDQATWQIVDPIQSGPSRSISSSALHARLIRPAEDPTQKTYVQRPPQVSVKQGDEPHKKEKKPQKPGKYICEYCSRPCAKPSVLQKHIRSHTGERPYPCIPCGFSFKTKSNLYKHRKSHAHRIKAGLASDIGVETCPSSLEIERFGGEDIDEPSEGESTDSEDETSTMSNVVKLSPQQKHNLPTSDSHGIARQQGISPDLFSLTQQNISQTSEESVTFTDPSPELILKSENTHTIKQKLALRLSERIKDSEEQTFVSPGSKGSMESGYFSRSESAEQQISPPNTNAKSYAEIILGKCGRIGQRTSILVTSNPLLGTAEEKTGTVPISVPRTQVIEHITKLITINEAVVDTSEIDSVKPRRSSLSRRSSIESPKATLYRDPVQFDVKSPGSSSQQDSKNLSEKTKAEHSFHSFRQAPSATETVPLHRSHSVPSSACTVSCQHPFRASYSFDDRMVDSEVLSHGHVFSSHPRLLKRQPAIELPLGMDYSIEECSPTSKDISDKTAEDQESEISKKSKKGGRVKGLNYECNICGARYKKKGNYETHKKYNCSELHILKPQAVETHSPVEIRKGHSEHESWPQLPSYKLGSSVELFTLRKRRKEKSFGDDEESQSVNWPEYETSPTQLESQFPSSSTTLSMSSNAVKQSASQSRAMSFSDVHTFTLVQESKEKITISKEISVIQHTSSFEKSESVEKQSSFDEEDKSAVEPSFYTARQHPHSSHALQPKLVRQHNIQVPEIFVTIEPDKSETEFEETPKEQEKVEEFLWPQRSQTLAQLPAEKLPPKKKRLRLAEMAQSSGDSSFESVSLTRSPSQDSCLSHASSHSVSLDREEGIKSEVTGRSSECTSKLLGHHMLAVPAHHLHAKEMRRSASEQTPNLSHSTHVSENRSKSFDYGNLTYSTSSSTPTAQERRKCFSVQQTSLSRHVELEPDLMPRDWKDPEQPSSSSHTSGMSAPDKSSSLSPKEQQMLKQNTRAMQPVTDETEKNYVSQHLSLWPVQPLLHLPEDTSECFSTQAMSSIISDPFSLQAVPPSIFHIPQIPLESTLLHSDHIHPQHFTSHALDIPLRHPYLHLKYTAASPFPSTFFIPVQSQFALPISAQVGEHYQQIKSEVSPPLNTLSLSPSKDYFSENICPPFQTPLALETSSQVVPRFTEPVVSMVVPVRIQTHMPLYGTAMYTTLSQILVTQPHRNSSSIAIQKINEGSSKVYHGLDLYGNLPKHGGNICAFPFLRMPFSKTDIGSYIPLTSVESVLGFDGSSSSVSGSKRMLSPAGSLELTMESQQLKRVKEEEELEERVVVDVPKVQTVLEEIQSSTLASLHSKTQTVSELEASSTSATHEPSLVIERHKSQLATVTTGSPHSKSPEKHREQDIMKIKVEKDDDEEFGYASSKIPSHSGSPPSLPVAIVHEETETKNVQTYPSLHATTNVSWCYLNYVKPNHTQQTDRRASVYSSWCISLYNPNLPGISTRTALSLLRSKQKTSCEFYTTADAAQTDSILLVPSRTQKPKMTETHVPAQTHKQTSMTVKEEEKRVKTEDSGPNIKHGDPSRVRIFEGGYKSNEDYIYVRGRGRGKYVCEECGIRCKKPSMLKKHIRTHTDHRPYVCKHCNFAFKTKGNLTKHMKSKAHSKKCQELGLGPPSLAELDVEEETSDERWPDSDVLEEHQFSDLDDTDDEDDSDVEEEDEDEEDENQEGKSPDPSPNIVTPCPSNEPRQSGDTSPVCRFSFRLQTSEPPENEPKPLVVSQTSVSQEILPHRRWSIARDMGESTAGPSRRHLLQETETSTKCFSTADCTSPRRGMPPCQCLPSAGEVSPLRCVSPQHLSPHFNISPRAYMSPEHGSSPPVRHLSPRREVTHLQYAVFRGGLPSPPRYPFPGREEPHLSRTDPQTNLKTKHVVFPSSTALPHRAPDVLELSGIKKPGPSALPRILVSPLTPHTLPRSVENMFTHLPLHSQHLQRIPYQMIPIGGIQMVQSRPSSQSSLLAPMLSELHSEYLDKEQPHQIYQGTSEQPLRTKLRGEREHRVISPLSTVSQHSLMPSTCCQSASTPPRLGMSHASLGSLKGERTEGEG